MKMRHWVRLGLGLAALWVIGRLLDFTDAHLLSVCGVIAFGVIAYWEGHDAFVGEKEEQEDEERKGGAHL